MPPAAASGDGGDPRRRSSLQISGSARALVTVAALVSAYLLAYEVRFEFQVPPVYRSTALVTLPLVVAVKYVALRVLGVHRQSWQFTSLWDLVAIVGAMVSSAVLLVVARFAVPPLVEQFGQTVQAVVPLGVIAADFALSVLLLAGVRALRRLQVEQRDVRRRRAIGADHPARRVVIIGAGSAGGMVAREIAARPDLGLEPVGFLDDNPATHGQRIQGVEVLGGMGRLARLAEEQTIDQAIIAVAGASGQVIRRLTDACWDAGVEAQIVPGVHEILDGRVELSRLRPVRIEDLLRRDAVQLDTSAIAQLVAGSCVMVTGAGGSIGAELCRLLLRFGPRTLLLVEQAEGALWAIHRELAGAGAGSIDAAGMTAVSDVEVVPVVADVCDQVRVTQLFARHGPSLVFHAAAHKHVPMMEANPGEAVKNNVFGTRVVADAALAAGVQRFVLVSTDKAVNPSSVMGATKRIAERYVQHLAANSGRVFVSVRFGNVLGSAGSVIPVFEQQIAAGGPVTVTHPDMCRYFMTIPEASALVVQAASVGQSGDVLVLDMGEPVRIDDLAADLIGLSGLRVGVDIEVVYTGIRPGEKLFEELALDSESTDVTAHPSIRITRTAQAGWEQASADLEVLWQQVMADDEVALRAGIARLVPEMRAQAIIQPSSGQPGTGVRRSAGPDTGQDALAGGEPAT